MIRNLIDNARRHGGDAAPEVTVSRRAPGYAPRSRCATTARASPEAERERIFEPFYRLAGLGRERPRLAGSASRWCARSPATTAATCSAARAAGGGSLFAITLPTLESASRTRQPDRIPLRPGAKMHLSRAPGLA